MVAFDTNYRARLWGHRQDARDLFMAAAAASSIVLPGLDDEKALFGEDDHQAIATRYQQAGAEVVAVKDGAKGVTIYEGGGSVVVPAAKPTAIVDTTAAGDSFCAAFLARLATGATAVAAAQFAVGIAAQVVAQRGALVEIAAD
jgi:2-dehydro-3-deoxygluconokinase